MVIGTALGLGNAPTIALAVLLAFVFGYSLTMLPLLRAGLALGVALPLAFASDSLSIAVMELVDNGIMLGVPDAMDATLSSGLFWGALAVALAIAYVVAFPLNRYLIARGQGHAVVHAYHGHEGHPAEPAIGSRRRLVLLGVGAMVVTIVVATTGALLLESDDSDEHDGEAFRGVYIQSSSANMHDRIVLHRGARSSRSCRPRHAARSPEAAGASRVTDATEALSA
jgi:Domain of unknown function (DUF4396)